MRRGDARDIIAASFREAARTKPVDRITIADILAGCGYSKTTFYRLYKDKYDLMAWDYTRSHRSIMERMDGTVTGWEKALLEYAELVAEQRDYLRNLLMHTSGLDSFSRYMKQIHFEGLRRFVLDASGMAELDVRTEMYARTYCQGVTDLICDWVMGAYDVTPQELAEVLDGCLTMHLRRYLV